MLDKQLPGDLKALAILGPFVREKISRGLNEISREH